VLTKNSFEAKIKGVKNMGKTKTTSGRLTFSAAAKLIGVDEQSFRTHYKRICPKVAAYPKEKRPYVSRTRLLAWTNADPEILNVWRQGQTRTALTLAAKKKDMAKVTVASKAKPAKAKPAKANKKPKVTKAEPHQSPKKLVAFCWADLDTALRAVLPNDSATAAGIHTAFNRLLAADMRMVCTPQLVTETVKTVITYRGKRGAELEALVADVLDRVLGVQEEPPCCSAMRTAVLCGVDSAGWAFCPYCQQPLAKDGGA
jgi:hypothetical protein